MSEQYWQNASADEAMQPAHAFVWEAMLETAGIDLVGKRILDVGCNRGGFLRLVADRYDIAVGFGYDPAASAIENARALAGRRRLEFSSADTIPLEWRPIDVAFSHEVLYLLHDPAAHAQEIQRTLAPGGIYYATLGVHQGSPLMTAWHGANRQRLDLPKLYAVDDIIEAFDAAGFDVSLARLAIRYLPASHAPRPALDWLEYYCDHKVILRLLRPARLP